MDRRNRYGIVPNNLGRTEAAWVGGEPHTDPAESERGVKAAPAEVTGGGSKSSVFSKINSA